MIFDLHKLETVAHALEIRGVRYGWGAKANPLSYITLETVQELDCSGFAQLMTWYATGEIIIPGTAWDQYHELRGWALREHSGAMYHKACSNMGALLMCFIEPTSLHAGHVWYVHDGRTYESHGGGGVSSRSWDTPILAREVSKILVMESR